MTTNRLDDSVYQRAEQLLRHHRPGLLRGDKIIPQWLDGGARFRYAIGTQFVLVDPQAGTRTPLDQLAAEASAPAGNPLEVRSPDQKLAVFRRGADLWARSDDGQEWALTTDGEPDRDYGSSPDFFMYSPLLERVGLPHLPPAVAWSPDSTRVLTHRTDQRGLRQQHLVHSRPADGGAPQLLTQRYALSGDDHLPMAEFVVIDFAEGTVVPAQAEPVAMPIVSPLMAGYAWWAEDSSAVYYLSQPRDGLSLSLHRLDPATGAVTTVLTETADTRVEPTQQQLGQLPMVRVLPGGDELLWYSQRDGWGHLYRYDARTGELCGQLTSGEWAVQQILHVDVAERVLYFVASGLVAEDPYRRSVCRVGLDGSGFAQLSNDGLDHVVIAAPNGKYFVDSASSTDTPPMTTVRGWDGQVLVELERADISRLIAAGWSAPERFKVTAADGHTDIYGVLYRPHGFDPNRSYPVIDHVYPNPAVLRVSPSFDAGWHGYDAEAVAALGFVVIALDGRGTPGRSKAFHDHSYRRLATAGLDDHAAALRQLAQSRPWMDLDRVGIFGISGGGVSTVRAMCEFPELYKVGVAESGNHDNRCYNPGFVETFDGLVEDETRDRDTNLRVADRLAGKLLLVHGGRDNNVYPHHTLRLADRLIAADKDFDLLIVPGADHVYVGYEHYVTRRKWDYLVRHLLGVEPPASYRLTPVPLDAAGLAGMFG